MDTQKPSTAEVPTFKLAKVGKERKRGGAWFGGGRGAGSGLRLLSGGAGTGGAGAAVGSGAVGAKILMIFVVSAIASFGSSRIAAILRGDAKPAAVASKGPFVHKGEPVQKYDDLSGVIKEGNAIPNSLGYLSGSIDGLTPEERAKKAADEVAARKAEEEAQKKADEEAAKEAPLPGAGAPDVAALVAGADKKDAKPGLRGFNKLSSSFGGSAGGSKLSGGPGLSGGVSRGFSAPSVKAQNGAIASFKGGAKTSTAKASRASSTPSTARGFAKRQLLNANRLSRQATSAGRAESSSEGASNAFEGGSAVGSSIQGSGVTGGPTQGAPSTPSGSSSGNSGSGSSTDCGTGQYVDANGNCADTEDPNTDNAAKYQSLLDLAQKLLLAAAILSAIAWILDKLPWPICKVIAMYMKYAVAAIGAVVCGLGIAIAAMSGGDFMIGAIVAIVGGYIAYTAYTSAVSSAGAQNAVAKPTEVAAKALTENSGDALLQAQDGGTALT